MTFRTSKDLRRVFLWVRMDVTLLRAQMRIVEQLRRMPSVTSLEVVRITQSGRVEQALLDSQWYFVHRTAGHLSYFLIVDTRFLFVFYCGASRR